MKYQFCIRFDNVDPNSAASKAVMDCNAIFSKNGYLDHTVIVGDNLQKKSYYYHLFKELTRFFFSVERNSIIGIQYPLLSINHVFKYFIKIIKIKGGKFFCVIHDLESLRKGGKNQSLIDEEIRNLNLYDVIIAHNDEMIKWLQANGIVKPMISLDLFDYLTLNAEENSIHHLKEPVVYAGNLTKSAFIYELPQVNQRFNLYGPGFNKLKQSFYENLTWCGEFSPLQIVTELKGSFGLIWDGNSIDRCDEILGNYLKYNNPHKVSLYISAGLPVIAPINSAVGNFIQKYKIGILIENLHDLNEMKILPQEYAVMKKNILAIRYKIINGQFFEKALLNVEQILC